MKSYHHQNLRAELIAKALELLQKTSIESLTLREVARATKVSHTAPYRHFKDKEALLAAIAEIGFNHLSQRGFKALEQPDPLNGYLSYGEEYIRFAAEHPQHFRIMFSGRFHNLCDFPELKQAGDQAFGILVEAVQRCQNIAIFRQQDSLPMALSSWSFVHGIANLYIDGRFARPNQEYPSVKEIWQLLNQDLIKGMLKKQT